MKRYIKSLIAACLSVCLIVCIGLFATACDNTDTDHYVVTVNLEDGSPATGVMVQLCSKDGVETCRNIQTGADGVATFDISDLSTTTYFSIHLDILPTGYTFDAENGEMLVYVKDGYSTTITLKKGSAEVPNPNVQNLEIKLGNASAKQQVSPEIEVAGFYELRSINPFTVSGEGFELTEGYNNVLLYLNPDDELSIGTASKELALTCVLLNPDETTTDASAAKTHTVSDGSAIVFNLAASESANFTNPFTLNNREGSNVTVSGVNFKATMQGNSYTQSFVVVKGKQFSVTTANNAAGKVVLSFSAPDTVVNANIGESKDFSVMLLPNKTSEESAETLNWIANTFYVTFTVQEAGLYKITVTSEFADDKIGISQTGSDVHYPTATEHSDDKNLSNTYYAVYQLNAGTTYRAFVSSGVNNYETYSEGNEIKYTAFVEKYTPAN